MRRWGTPLLVALLVWTAGTACEREPERRRAAPAAPDTAAAAPDTMAPAEPPDSAAPAYEEPVVIYLEASPRAIENAAAGVPPTDFEAIADDLMYYRASALSILQRQPVRVVRLVGRRPLRFLVGEEVRSFDFGDKRSLDLVVLYEPGQEPRALAPVEVSADPSMVTRYFRAGRGS